VRKRLLVLAAAGILASCSGTEEAGNEAAASGGGDSSTGGNSQQGERSIGDAVGQSPDLSRFSQAIQAAGLADPLKSGVPYTVFAPVDSAFEAVPDETLSRLMSAEGDQGRERLSQLLTFHIVPRVVTAQDLDAAIRSGQGRATITTVSGANLTIAREGGSLVVSDPSGGRARIVQADRIQSNGVIHRIDSVLMAGGGR
jgi:uncharacterized surface protein with fasciclin (FAS1) repeats